MKYTLVVALAAALAAGPVLATPGTVVIRSFIKVGDDLGEVRGRVELNGDPVALVTLSNGNTNYSTLTDAQGAFAALIALRSNSVTATARGLDGSGGRSLVEAALDGVKDPIYGPAPAELYRLCKGILAGESQVTATTVTRLTQLMDAAIMHGGGAEYDQRMVLLMLGSIDHIIARGTLGVAQRDALQGLLGGLGRLLYKGVVRGMDGEPIGK